MQFHMSPIVKLGLTCHADGSLNTKPGPTAPRLASVVVAPAVWLRVSCVVIQRPHLAHQLKVLSLTSFVAGVPVGGATFFQWVKSPDFFFKGHSRDQ